MFGLRDSNSIVSVKVYFNHNFSVPLSLDVFSVLDASHFRMVSIHIKLFSHNTQCQWMGGRQQTDCWRGHLRWQGGESEFAWTRHPHGDAPDESQIRHLGNGGFSGAKEWNKKLGRCCTRMDHFKWRPMGQVDPKGKHMFSWLWLGGWCWGQSDISRCSCCLWFVLTRDSFFASLRQYWKNLCLQIMWGRNFPGTFRGKVFASLVQLAESVRSQVVLAVMLASLEPTTICPEWKAARCAVLEVHDGPRVEWQTSEGQRLGFRWKQRIQLIYAIVLKVGFLGQDGECHECTEGATCPGSGEVEVLPGYFSFSEDPGSIYRCHGNALRCPGGTCADGRESTSMACSACLPGLRASEAGCIPCGGEDHGYVSFVNTV